MALDFDVNHLPDGAKAAINGVPFLAAVVKDVPTPYYTKLLQAVVTFMVLGLIGWSASVVMANRDRNELLLNQLTVLNSNMQHLTKTVADNKGDIKALQGRTKDRVYRSEWAEKNREQDARLLHLERVSR